MRLKKLLYLTWIVRDVGVHLDRNRQLHYAFDLKVYQSGDECESHDAHRIAKGRAEGASQRPEGADLSTRLGVLLDGGIVK